MKIRTQLLIAIALMMVCLLSGCSEDVFISTGSSPPIPSSSMCPNYALCEEWNFNTSMYYDNNSGYDVFVGVYYDRFET